MQIFISYSRKNSDLVAPLVEDLQALGHTVWIDRELTVTGGQNWWDNLLYNIRACDLFVLALTPASLASEPCQHEWRYAATVNRRILPIMISPVNILTLPPELQKLQLLMYTERNKQQRMELAASLNNMPPPRPLPNPIPPQPDIPLSPLSQIGIALDNPELSADEQKALVFELEGFLANESTRAGAQELLQRLHDRYDTTRPVADKIRSLLAAGQQGKRGSGRVLAGVASLIGVLVILFIAGFVLKVLPGRADTPSPESPTRITQAATQPASATASTATSAPNAQAATTMPTVTANNQWTAQTQAFDGVDMVLVPAGCFVMGTSTPAKGFENEQPTTHICFDKPFWIDKTEVTQAQFKKFGGQAGNAPSFTGDNRPVENVTWFEAADFCATKRSGRLLTEAEWEYAARGPDDLIYPWGNEFVAANVVSLDNSGGQTADVGSKADGKSWVGALDMLGNVSEWTSTIYDPQRFTYPYNANDGRENTDDKKSARIVRGGAWNNNADSLHSAVRANYLPINSFNYLGFRCVRTAPIPGSAAAATTSTQSTQAPTSIPTVTANNQWTPQTQSFGGVDMMLVPPGCYMMGTDNPPSANYNDEKPTTKVCFDKPFWIDKTEVTQKQFRQLGGEAQKGSAFTGANHPVEQITWLEARAFCANNRGGRLPTEAEWEYAARGPDDLIYAWGNTFAPTNLVYGASAGSQTTDVGSISAGVSWVGALDMNGNVSEWVSSLYKSYPYDKSDGRESTTDSTNQRVLRGGAWSINDIVTLRSAFRNNAFPNFTSNSLGFRCARDF